MLLMPIKSYWGHLLLTVKKVADDAGLTENGYRVVIKHRKRRRTDGFPSPYAYSGWTLHAVASRLATKMEYLACKPWRDILHRKTANYFSFVQRNKVFRLSICLPLKGFYAELEGWESILNSGRDLPFSKKARLHA